LGDGRAQVILGSKEQFLGGCLRYYLCHKMLAAKMVFVGIILEQSTLFFGGEGVTENDSC